MLIYNIFLSILLLVSCQTPNYRPDWDACELKFKKVVEACSALYEEHTQCVEELADCNRFKVAVLPD